MVQHDETRPATVVWEMSALVFLKIINDFLADRRSIRRYNPSRAFQLISWVAIDFGGHSGRHVEEREDEEGKRWLIIFVPVPGSGKSGYGIRDVATFLNRSGYLLGD